MKLKAIMRVRDFSVRHTTRAPQGGYRSLPLFSRGSAMPILAGGIVLALVGTLFAQPPPAPKGDKPAAEPAPVARPAAKSKLQMQMAIDKPLMTLEEDKEHARNYLRHKTSKVLFNGVLNETTRPIIDEWIEWKIYRMTITEVPKPKPVPAVPAAVPAGPPAFAPAPAVVAAVPLPDVPIRKTLPALVKKLLVAIRGVGKKQPNAALKDEFRKYILDGVISKSRDLFDNSFVVRLNVVMLLSRLDLDAGGFGGKGAVAYAPVAVPLLEILRDKDQTEAVKIAALRGLKRVLLIGKVNLNQKNEIANEFMTQLEQKASMYWYPMRLVEALGCFDERMIPRVVPGAAAPQQRPFHVQTLVDVMRDQSQHWIVRTEAARSLGRVSLDAGVNSALIAHEIVVLCHSMAVAYNKNPNRFYWNQCFLNIYLAFTPLDSKETARIAQVKPATLISKRASQKSISDAYQQILPAVRHIIRQPEIVNKVRTNTPIPAAAMQAVTTWIKENKPSVGRLAPGLPQLQAPKPMAAKAVAPAIRPAVFLSNE